mmetsp:Transcript_15969/g.30655  ORF Transcript_15969/g.30655 Transcript_15969/m.30655 type:complete len:347 (+) Transcript_15969:1197-2237(+)
MQRGDGAGAFARGEEGGLVEQALQPGSGEAHGALGNHPHVGARLEAQARGARVQSQHRQAATLIWQIHSDCAVESARSPQRRVQHFRPVGCRQHNHLWGLAPSAVEPVHGGEELVEGLAVVSAGEVALGAHGVQLVDEDERGRRLVRALEQVPDAGGPHPHVHVVKAGARGVEEGHVRRPGHRARQQRLARPRRSHQQHSPWGAGPHLGVPLRVFQVVHHLRQLGFGVVAAGDVLEGVRALLPARRVGLLRRALRAGKLVLGHPVEDGADHQQVQQRGAEGGQGPPEPRLLRLRGGAHLHLGLVQQRRELLGRERRGRHVHEDVAHAASAARLLDGAHDVPPVFIH